MHCTHVTVLISHACAHVYDYDSYEYECVPSAVSVTNTVDVNGAALRAVDMHDCNRGPRRGAK